MTPETLATVFHDYVHRLRDLPKTDAAFTEFGQDLTRDSENGVLTPDEQEALVIMFLYELTFLRDRREPGLPPEVPRGSSHTFLDDLSEGLEN